VHVAAAWGKIDLLDILLTKGGDPTILDYEGLTAMDYARKEENEEVILKLKSFFKTNFIDLVETPTLPKYTLELGTTNLLLNSNIYILNFLERIELFDEVRTEFVEKNCREDNFSEVNILL